MDNDLRRQAFVEAADELYREKGIRQTSIRDIAERVGVTRSLFYHYFPDKQAMTDAVIERRVDEFMDYLINWTAQLHGSDTRESLVSLTKIARSFLNGPTSLIEGIVRDQDATLFQHFVVRSSRLLADHFVQSRRQGAFIHLSNVQHPRESFYVLSVGVMSTMIRDPQTPDEVIADVIVDTLHIDLNRPPSTDAEQRIGEGPHI